MQSQWKSTHHTYLRSALRQIQNQEQTLELRLTEDMPDIGRVLCCWGQVQLRSKEWRSDSIHVLGGVNVWVLYAPEDGTEPRCLEGWMPFQAKWSLPEHSREGVIRADVVLRNLDGRTLSPRKILTRGSLALLAEALVPEETAIYTPDDMPQQVCLLTKTYPVQLLQEAGEKLFTLEDTISIAGQMPKKILCCRLMPMITEQAVTGSRLVLRGQVCIRYVALDEEGRLCGGTLELPFAQFAQLENDYDKEASCAITMALSDGDYTLDADGLQIKCGLIAQYTVHGRSMLQVAEDAYSPTVSVKPTVQMLQLQVLLERLRLPLEAESPMQIQIRDVVDVAFRHDHPAQYREDDRLVVEMPGQFQVLYYDQGDQLQTATENWTGHWEIPAGEGCAFRLGCVQADQSDAVPAGDHLVVRSSLALDVQTGAEQAMPMVTELEVGQPLPIDPERPSVILRRGGNSSLWGLAKDCGSTMEAISKANNLTGEPDPEQMLLIPVV